MTDVLTQDQSRCNIKMFYIEPCLCLLLTVHTGDDDIDIYI